MDAIIIQPMTKEEARSVTEKIRNAASELRGLLVQVYERDGWKALDYRSMDEYMRLEFPDLSRANLHQQLQAGRTVQQLKSAVVDFPGCEPSESVLRPIATKALLDDPDAQSEIWQAAVERSDNNKPTAADVQTAKRDYQHKPKPASKPVFNRTNENIEWAMWSWNPVTGCLHDCDYCYARDIANRFYPQGFEPTYHPERLTAPQNTTFPLPRWNGDIGYKGVFVCSMADLFGKWVPSEWIKSAIKAMDDNPQWEFLLLTKFPIRMADFDYPPNVWLGTTVDYQWRVERAEKAFRKIKASGFGGICWLSCEPMMEQLNFSSLDMFDWLVMGGASRSSRTPEHRPPFDHIVTLYNQARASGLLVYQKTNLIPGMSDEQRLREYPI